MARPHTDGRPTPSTKQGRDGRIANKEPSQHASERTYRERVREVSREVANENREVLNRLSRK